MINKIKKSLNEEIVKINKKDIFIVISIMIIYGIITFINLGDLNGINTYHKSKAKSSIKLNIDNKDVYKIKYYTGYNDAKFNINLKNQNDELIILDEIKSRGIFTWNEIILDHLNTKEIELEFEEESTLGEIALYDSNNKLVKYKTNIKEINDEEKIIPKEISYMNTTYFDEVYFARTAYEYVYNLKIYEWTHPPLGKIIEAIPIYITHKLSPLNYRLMSNISGILIVGVMYIMGAIFFKKRKYAILTSIIMSLDTLHFVHTRMGTLDPHLVLFILLANMFMLLFTKTDKFKYLLFSGIFFALSISIKWTGMYGGIALAIIYFFHIIKTRTINIKHIEKGFLYFVLIPIVIYISTFLIFSNNYIKTTNINKVIEQNVVMYNYHSKLDTEHFFSSKWYTWPISYKPVWLHEQKYDDNTKETISNVGNIILWIGGIIGLIYIMYKSIKKKDEKCIYLIATILSLWLPYSFISRIMFLYHYYPVIPFILLALMHLLKDINENKKIKFIVPIFVAASILFFVIYYPVTSGIRTNVEYIEKLKLLKSWYF